MMRFFRLQAAGCRLSNEIPRIAKKNRLSACRPHEIATLVQESHAIKPMELVGVDEPQFWAKVTACQKTPSEWYFTRDVIVGASSEPLGFA